MVKNYSCFTGNLTDVEGIFHQKEYIKILGIWLVGDKNEATDLIPSQFHRYRSIPKAPVKQYHIIPT